MNSDSLLASKVKTGYAEAQLSEDGSAEVYSQHRDGQHVCSQMATRSSIARHPEAGEPCHTPRSGVNPSKGHTLDTQRSANHTHADHPARGQLTSGSCLTLTENETQETEETPPVRVLPSDSSSSEEDDFPIYPPWRSYLISRQCANPPDIKVDFLDMVECGDSRAASAYKLTSRFDDRPVVLTTLTSCLDPILEDPTTQAKETRRPRHQILKQFATHRNGFGQISDTGCNTARENDKNKPTQNANKTPVEMTTVTTGKPTKFFLGPNGKLTYQGSPPSGRSTPVSSDDSASNRFQRDNKRRIPLQAGREGPPEGLVPERPRDGRDMSFKVPSSLSSLRHNPVLSNVNSSCFQETGEHSNPPAHQQAEKEFPISKLRSAKVNTSLAEAGKKRLKELFPAVRCRIQESSKRQDPVPARRRQGTSQDCSSRALKTLAPLSAATGPQRCPQMFKGNPAGPGQPRLKIMENGKCKGERVLTPRPHRVRPYRMLRKGMRLPASRTAKRRPENFNINFNSETDGGEEDAQSYSFIGYYFYELWKNQCMCDVRLKVGNTSFLAHKLVLAAFSDLFHPEDPSQMPTLCFDIQDVSEEAICLILQYLYTNKMEITEAVLESVYTAARVLEIEEVQDLVLRILSRPTLENFEKYMGIRQRVGIPGSILEVFREFVQENLMSIQDSQFIMNLGIAEIEQLLQDEDVKVESEEDVIHFILKWIKYNPCQRSVYMSQLLSLVNYDCISPDILASIVEQNRDLFDLGSMDIMMRAFKKYALNCKVPPGYCWKDNGSSSNCATGSNCAITGNCTSGANCSSANNYAAGATCTSFSNACGDQSEGLNEGPDNIVEFQEAVEDDYPLMEPARCMRRYTAISPQDIRRNARKLFYNQDCSSYEPQPSGFRTVKLGCKRRCSGDSSNNFPEYTDSRSRSASVESKSSQGSNGSRRPSVSRSYTDMGPPKFRGGSGGGGGGGLKESPAITKTYSTRGGRPVFDTGEPEDRGGSENGWRGRNEGRRVRRGPENCPSYLRSRSSSRSSESSLKQSPSTKRVTFV